MKKISISKKVIKAIEKFAPKNEPTKEKKPEKKKFIKMSVKKNKSMKIIAAASLLGVILSLGVISYYFYHKYETVPSVETDDIITRISKYMELPSGEKPTLATVTDKEKLKNQLFFTSAENGDKALIYTQAKKAILYRPSINKIIEVMYISADQNKSGDDSAAQGQTDQNQNQAQTQPAPDSSVATTTATDNQTTTQTADQSRTPEAQKIAKVVVYNGTTQKGMAKNIANKLAGISAADVISIGNAKDNYTKTIVIDLTGNNADLAQKIADTVGGEIGSFPQTETKPDSDILVIGGSDFKN